MICAAAGLLTSVTACGGGGGHMKHRGAMAGPKSPIPTTPTGGASPPTGGGHEAVLEVLGTGTVPGIYYNAGTNGNDTNVTLPWKKTARVFPGHLIAVLVSATQQKAVTCKITLDGKVVVTKKGAVAQCSYTPKK